MKRWRKYLLWTLLPVLALLLTDTMAPLAAENIAATMQLTKAEGTVEVSSSTGKGISLIDNMRLYNGYQIETMEESYAWISLDKTKLVKVDAVSDVSVRKSGKKLEILAESGTLLFNVTEPLKEDESLNIHVSTMVAGIRGTCGWVEVLDESRTQLTLLEGTVEVSVVDPVDGQSKMETVSAGETVVCQVYRQTEEGDKCDIRREECLEGDIPGFVLAELLPDVGMRETIYQETGIDLRELTEQDVEKRLQEDEEAVRGRLEEIEEVLKEQEEQSTMDLVWGGTGNVPGTDEDARDANRSAAEEQTASDPSIGSTGTPAPGTEPVQDDTPAHSGSTKEPAPSQESVTNTVTFDTKGGNAMPKVTVKSGDRLSRPADPTRPGYSFNGWYTDAVCMEAYDFSEPVTRDLTLYAGWTENAAIYTVTFDTQGGSDVSEAAVKSGDRVSSPADPARPGYSFNGWYTDAVCTKAYDFSEPVTRDLTLYAGWTENAAIYTVTFDSQGGSDVSEAAVKSGDRLPRPADPTRPGYSFNGWYTDAVCTKAYDFSEPVTRDLTLYAGWTENAAIYTVTFDTQGGSDVPEAAVKSGDRVSSPADPTRPGYSFNGWYTDVMCTEAYDFSEPVTGNLTLYAGWTAVPDIYTVRFDTNGCGLADDAESTRTVQAGTAIGELPELVRPLESANYTFSGWYTERSGGEEVTSGTIITDNMTVYARWYNWVLGSEGKLTISGAGFMPDYPEYGPWNGNKVQTAELTDGITRIGGNSFRDCIYLTSVTIPDSVTSIGTGAFSSCSSLTNVMIPDSVTRIGTNIFLNCINLTSVTIPDSVKSIDASAFQGCNKLADVYFGGTEAQWEALGYIFPDTVTMHYNATP